MTEQEKLVEALRICADDSTGCGECPFVGKCVHAYYMDLKLAAAEAIEALQAEVKRLQNKLCDWCAVCPKERRKPEDCELLGENPVMYVPSGAKMEVQDG